MYIIQIISACANDVFVSLPLLYYTGTPSFSKAWRAASSFAAIFLEAEADP